jgi:hypothetical protein
MRLTEICATTDGTWQRRQHRLARKVHRHLINRLAATERFRNQQSLIFGPAESRRCFLRGFVAPRARGLVQQSLHVFAQSPAIRRLQIVAIRGQHVAECVGGRQDNFRNQSGMYFHEVGSQDVFQFVCQLAQFAIATRGGISLQRVHSPAHAAQAFLVAGVFLQRQPGIVHRLQNFLRALKKEIAKLRGPVVGRKRHCGPSIR